MASTSSLPAGESHDSFPPVLLSTLRSEPCNRRCADCPVQMPEWVSLQHGTFICRQCAAVHRGLGVGVSRVRSLELDLWSQTQLGAVRNGGNARFFAFCERADIAINMRNIELDHLHASIESTYSTPALAAYRLLLGAVPSGGSGAAAAPAPTKEHRSFFRAAQKPGAFDLAAYTATHGGSGGAFAARAATERVAGPGLHTGAAGAKALNKLHYEKLWPHGYDACVAQCWESKRACKIVANSLAEQAKIEARYAAFLDRIIGSTDRLEHEEAETTIGAAWRALLKLAVSEAKQHHTLASLMEREVRRFHTHTKYLFGMFDFSISIDL